jgi:glycosyltransferase involved in cell wall biosynthesis
MTSRWLAVTAYSAAPAYAVPVTTAAVRLTMKTLVVHAPPLLVRELASRGHDLSVAHAPWHFRELPPGMDRGRFIPFDATAKTDPRAIWAMARIIRAHRPDLVHAFSPRTLAHVVLATMWMRSPPAIVSFRGITAVPHRTDPASHVTFLSRRVARHACESEAVAAGLVAGGVPRDRCTVVYNCVHREAINAVDPAEARRRFGIPAGAFLVGSIADVRPIKGIDILLRAVLSSADLGDAHVLIVGRIRDAAVERLCRDPRWRGRLHLAGFIPGAAGLAGVLDAFVMPSRAEGLSRALLEAMCLGTCPVVSDAGGMKELVRHEREGIVFPREGVRELAAALARLRDDRALAARLGREASARVADMCSPGAMAARVEGCYRTVAAACGDRRRMSAA